MITTRCVVCGHEGTDTVDNLADREAYTVRTDGTVVHGYDLDDEWYVFGDGAVAASCSPPRVPHPDSEIAAASRVHEPWLHRRTIASLYHDPDTVRGPAGAAP